MSKKVPCIVCTKFEETKDKTIIATVCDSCMKKSNIQSILKKFDNKKLKALLQKVDHPEHFCTEVNEFGEIV